MKNYAILRGVEASEIIYPKDNGVTFKVLTPSNSDPGYKRPDTILIGDRLEEGVIIEDSYRKKYVYPSGLLFPIFSADFKTVLLFMFARCYRNRHDLPDITGDPEPELTVQELKEIARSERILDTLGIADRIVIEQNKEIMIDETDEDDVVFELLFSSNGQENRIIVYSKTIIGTGPFPDTIELHFNYSAIPGSSGLSNLIYSIGNEPNVKPEFKKSYKKLIKLRAEREELYHKNILKILEERKKETERSDER